DAREGRAGALRASLRVRHAPARGGADGDVRATIDRHAGRVARVRAGATGDRGRGGDRGERQGATHHGQVHRTPVRRHTGNGLRGLAGGDPERGPVRGGRGQAGGGGSPVGGARVGVR